MLTTIDCAECGYSYGASAEYSEGRWWPNERAIERHEQGHVRCERCGQVIHQDHEASHLRLDCEKKA